MQDISPLLVAELSYRLKIEQVFSCIEEAGPWISGEYKQLILIYF